MTTEQFTQNIANGRMKRRDWAMIVCVAIVDAPRIIDSYIGLHGDKVRWELWPTVHGLTGLGMACIAGLSIAQCLSALAPGRATQTESSTRNLLMVLTVAAIVALGLQVLPPILGAPADGLWRVVWAVSAVASPLLVVAATPVAHILEQSQTAQPVSQAVNIEALRSEWRADIARVERKQTLQAVQVNVSNAQQSATETAQPDVTVRKPVAQLSTATTVEGWPQRALAVAQQAIANGEKPNWTRIGAELGQTRQNVTKRVKPMLEVQS